MRKLKKPLSIFAALFFAMALFISACDGGSGSKSDPLETVDEPGTNDNPDTPDTPGTPDTPENPGTTPVSAAVTINLIVPDSYNNDMQDGGKNWFEIKINNAAAIKGTNWKVRTGTSKHINDLMSGQDISTWDLADGDIIRIHPGGTNATYAWSGTTDTAKNDNNADRWDFKATAEYFISYQYATIWVEDANGAIVDFVAYQTDKNTSAYWLLTDSSNPSAIADQAVAAGQWTANSLEDAFKCEPSVSMYMRLKTGVSDGRSKSDWENVSSLSAPTAPAAAAVTEGDGSLSLSWTAVSGATSYNVFCSTGSSFSDAEQSGGDITATSYTLSSLTNGTKYYVWLKAKNDAGSSEQSLAASGTPKAPTALPSTPGTPTVTSGNASLNVSWSAVADASSYEVRYSTTDDSSSATLADDDITDTTYQITGLTNGTLYYVWVRAVNSIGSSGFSPSASATPAVPTIALAFANSDMEADMHNSFGLKPSESAYTAAAARSGSRGLHVSGTVSSSNSYVFTSAVNMNAKGSYTKIVFWVKGTATGNGLSVNLGPSSGGDYYNLGDVTTDKTVTRSGNNSYTGSVDTGGDWVKITLDLTTLEKQPDTSQSVFSLKVGKNAICDFYVDDIQFE